LPHDIEPNASVEMEILITNLKKGKNIITVSMVQELVAWFHDKGSKTLEFTINIDQDTKE